MYVSHDHLSDAHDYSPPSEESLSLSPFAYCAFSDVTGPADATKAIVVIYDIFGYFDQTVQGADILAYGDDHHKYKVFMPDWFRGKPCPIE